MIFTDVSITSAIGVSIQVSVISVALSSLPGIWIGTVLGIRTFRCREILITFLYTSLAFPTVVIGLMVYSLLSRNGPLGSWGLLYTKTAIIIGQILLIIPIIATFTLSAIRRLDSDVVITARSLGAKGIRLYLTVIREARYGIIAAIIAALGRALSEVGISMILGGNIAGVTRTITTTIALEHDKGQFNQAMILGVLLLMISLGINILFHAVQNRPESKDAAGF